MNDTKSLSHLQKKINVVQQALMELNPIHPGSVSMQHQVCGRTGCRCMDPQNPRRHGPYHKLTYVHRGKSVCRFVRADCADEIKKRLAAYKTFRNLIDRLIDLSIQKARIEFFSPAPKHTTQQPASNNSRKSPSKKPRP